MRHRAEPHIPQRFRARRLTHACRRSLAEMLNCTARCTFEKWPACGCVSPAGAAVRAQKWPHNVRERVADPSERASCARVEFQLCETQQSPKTVVDAFEAHSVVAGGRRGCGGGWARAMGALARRTSLLHVLRARKLAQQSAHSLLLLHFRRPLAARQVCGRGRVFRRSAVRASGCGRPVPAGVRRTATH